MFRNLCFLFAVWSALIAGCAHAPLNPHTREPATLPAELAAYYTYPAPDLAHASREPLDEHERFRRALIRFPLSTPGFEPTEPTVEIEWYESKEPGRRPAILFSPILGGDYPLERGLCRFFANQGFHVALTHRKTLKVSPEKDAAYLELLLRQAIVRSRQVVDWMAAQPNVDTNRLASFGISMGGMANVVVAAVEPRLRCHVITLAGGSLADILRDSHDKLLTKPRAKYLAHHHIDLPTMHRLLTEHIRTDPLRMAPYVDSRHVLFTIALFDRTIGRANAFRLRDALGRPPTTFLPFGHYTSYLALPVLKRDSVRFFKRQLALP